MNPIEIVILALASVLFVVDSVIHVYGHRLRRRADLLEDELAAARRSTQDWQHEAERWRKSRCEWNRIESETVDIMVGLRLAQVMHEFFPHIVSGSTTDLDSMMREIAKWKARKQQAVKLEIASKIRRGSA